MRLGPPFPGKQKGRACDHTLPNAVGYRGKARECQTSSTSARPNNGP